MLFLVGHQPDAHRLRFGLPRTTRISRAGALGRQIRTDNDILLRKQQQQQQQRYTIAF